MINIFALTTRGLEGISAEEIATLPGIQLEAVTYRRIAAICAGDLSPLLNLRTVDDVFLDVVTWSGIVRQRKALATLNEHSANLDLYPAATLCATLRPIPPVPRFSITTNFVGKRNYNTQEIKQICAKNINARHGWTYTPNDGNADLNIRLFIEHSTAFVGVRLGEAPLYRRSYKQAHIPGSLKPSVAAAMLTLADVQPGRRLLDPCCGAGTILIEGALWGAVVHGGDIAREAQDAARANIDAAHVIVDLTRWDAQHLSIADHTIAYIVSNLPWGRAVDVQVDGGCSNPTETLYKHVCREMQRVLAPGGRIVLLTSLPHLVRFDNLHLDTQFEISLFGQTPTILVFSARCQTWQVFETCQVLRS